MRRLPPYWSRWSQGWSRLKSLLQDLPGIGRRSKDTLMVGNCHDTDWSLEGCQKIHCGWVDCHKVHRVRKAVTRLPWRWKANKRFTESGKVITRFSELKMLEQGWPSVEKQSQGLTRGLRLFEDSLKVGRLSQGSPRGIWPSKDTQKGGRLLQCWLKAESLSQGPVGERILLSTLHLWPTSSRTMSCKIN